jgi:hypothetical protein
MALDLTAVDAALARAVADLQVRLAELFPGGGAAGAEDLLDGLARLLDLDPPQRVLRAAMPHGLALWDPGRDPAAPNAHRDFVLAYDNAVRPVRAAAMPHLPGADVLAWLLAHPGAPEAVAVVRDDPPWLPADVRRSLVDRAPDNIVREVGGVELRFLARDEFRTVVIAGTRSFTPAHPEIVAAAGDGPRYVVLRPQGTRQWPYVLDLAELRYAAPQSEVVFFYDDPRLLRLDDAGVVLRLADGRKVHLEWSALLWKPLPPR